MCFPSNDYKKSIKNRLEFTLACEQDMKIISINLDQKLQMLSPPIHTNVIITQVNLSDSTVTRVNDSREFKMILNFIKTEIHMSEAFKKPHKQTNSEWFKCFDDIKLRKGSLFNNF